MVMISEVQRIIGTRPYDKDKFVVYHDGYRIKREYFEGHLPRSVELFISEAKASYEPIGCYTRYTRKTA